MTTTEKLPMVTRADWVPGPKQGRWTYADYAALPEDGKRYEIVNGVLYMTPAPSWSHQDVVGELFAYLRDHLRSSNSGRVFVSPIDVELAPNTVFQPDVVVLLKASEHKLGEHHIIGAPDLVIEVASPGTSRYDLREKQDAYARAGIPEYWVVNPDAHTIEVLVLDIGSYVSLGVYTGKATLPSQVLPEFAALVEQFFVSG